jgi:RimJ/RimL family protein N-acetyltransferase
MRKEVIQSVEKEDDIIFESERLYYRRIIESDALQIFEMDSNPEVIRFVFIPLSRDLEDSMGYIHNIRKQYQDHGTGRLAVIEKDSNTFIG